MHTTWTRENICRQPEDKIWFNDQGQVHRKNKPAIVRGYSKSQYWLKNGLKHRKGDLPAIIKFDMTNPVHSQTQYEYWVNGQRHATVGPAIITHSGKMEWWQNGKRHRLDGPAVIDVDRRMEWWVDGEMHREDGPAVIWRWGSVAWWLNGEQFSFEDYIQKVMKRARRKETE